MRLLKQVPIFLNAKVNFFLLTAILFSSCTVTVFTKKPKDKSYIGKPVIEVKGGNLKKTDIEAVQDRLASQLDDSSRVRIKSPVFFLDIVKKPPVFDTTSAAASVRNMKASLFHIGFYNPQGSYDSSASGKKINVTYKVDVGKRTLIDTVSYRLVNPALQELAMKVRQEALIKKDLPVTKSAVLGEMSRLVDTFRNNGFYKFTATELKVLGDTSIEALTSVSDDPFEQLRLLAEAQAKRDSPRIKLAVVLNKPDDSARLQQYSINEIYVLPDYRPGDNINDSLTVVQKRIRPYDFIFRYHNEIYKPPFVSQHITIRKGDLYSQNEYYRTLSNLARTGQWQSVNIQVNELPGHKLNYIIELIPVKKFGFEAALEASYSAVSNQANAIGGSLFGLSLNTSLTNRNMWKEGVRMTHGLRAGIEFNNNARSNASSLINSTEVGYSNGISIPKIILLRNSFFKKADAGESFINSSVSYANRLSLFNLQAVNISVGTSGSFGKNNTRINKLTIRPFYGEFNYLFNITDSFKNVLNSNRFLRYSYNTAFVTGMAASFTHAYYNPSHANSVSKERTLKINLEESGLTWGLLPVLNKYKYKYLKTDIEYRYIVNYNKTAVAFRVFTGIGLPIGNDNNSLPFFKQFFGGGSTSMRGWPVRGIGLGAQKLKPYSKNIFNERTGDIKLEGNAEFRYEIFRIIPNTLTLRGALFADIGNVWNKRPEYDTFGNLSSDTSQFKLKNLYKDLGLSAGTGLRLDFNYVVLRLDFGFRFKRPETSYINNGWKAPSIGFDDFLPKLFNVKYKEWRYENFNFTIGINYPF
ncbi:MAG: BamA/TamA family outer membrane protein [Ferruginibacter sp.]